MIKLIAFGASTSKASINKRFATFAAQQFKKAQVEVLDLNDFEMPLFSVDIEHDFLDSEILTTFLKKIDESDLLVISMAEHNGNFTAAFKNLFDWLSRVKGNMFEGKNIFLISTSPGRRGGAGSLGIALERFPRHGAHILDYFSLPSFNENFDPINGITNQELHFDFMQKVNKIHRFLTDGMN